MNSPATTQNRIPPGLLSIGVSRHALCTRCGTCVGACPTQALAVGDDLYPRLIPDRCISCGLCSDVCPGARLNYRKLTQLTFGHDRDIGSFDGQVQRTFVGYGTDETIRQGGAGGGIVTALCWDLLKHGEVDGCIVARMKPGRPWEGETFIARSYDDLLASQGSKYQIIPINAVFHQIREWPERFAYVALPCQVHGFRLLSERDPILRERIRCVIGLFCGGSLEPTMVTELLTARGIALHEIADFQFRGGDWPGQMRALMKTGEFRELHTSNYKDGAYNYFTSLYMPERCQTCIDGSGQFADISISDAWTREPSGEYRFKSCSRLLARTDLGVAVMMNAIRRGTIEAQDVTHDTDYETHRLQTKRKGLSAPLRAARRLAEGKPAPMYDRPPPPADLSERITERSASIMLWLATYRWFRFPLMRFLTSSAAIPLVKWRLWRKKRKYRARSRKDLGSAP